MCTHNICYCGEIRKIFILVFQSFLDLCNVVSKMVNLFIYLLTFTLFCIYLFINFCIPLAVSGGRKCTSTG